MDESLNQEGNTPLAAFLVVEPRRALTAARRWVVASRAELLCAALLTVMCLQMLAVISRKSITCDEVVMIPSAYYHLAAGNFQLVNEHPPLSKILAAIPLLFVQPTEVAPERIGAETYSPEAKWAYQESFWHDNPSIFESISFWARVPMIALTLALGLLIFVFARELFGARAALFAVALFTLEPTVLAHGRIVQTDIPATFGYLLLFFMLYRYLNMPTYKGAAWVGTAAGLALLAKFSMLLVGPILALFFLGLLWWAPRKEWKRATLAGHAALVAVAAILVVNAAYFFQHRPLAEVDAQWIELAFPSVSGMVTQCARALSHILPTDFVLGVLQQVRHNQDGHPAGLLGMYRKFGWWYYFPVAFTLKSTIPFLLLSLASIFWGVREWVKTHQVRFLWMLVPFAVYTTFVLFSRIDIGVRYYLPAYSLLFILCGALLDRLVRLRRARVVGIAIAALLLGWCGVETVRAYPNYTPYMNQLAWAHPHWWYLSDSNVEWGDDVSELAAYLHARGETKVRAALLGGFLTLDFYKVEYVDLLGEGESQDTRYVAIGASFLNGSTVPEYAAEGVRRLEEQRINLFDAYRHRVPEAVIGNSIYLYRMHE